MKVLKVIVITVVWPTVALILSGCGGGGGEGNSDGSSATLRWVAPATRVDDQGLKMGELDGYIISYGQDSANLDSRIMLNDASVMKFTLQGLTNGRWFFSVQTVDVNGLVSAPSPQVSKVI